MSPNPRNLVLFDPSDGSGVRVALIGEYDFEPASFDRMARDVIGQTREFWGADQKEAFVVTAMSLKGSDGFMAMSGTGRAGGFAVWIDERMPLDAVTWLLSHEYLHTFNPSRLGRGSSHGEPSALNFWFSEGITDYYARALLVRSGIISRGQFVAQWNEVLEKYNASHARNWTGEEAAARIWEDGDTEALLYQRGAMLGAIWNARLIEFSNGAKNLDDVMRAQLWAAENSGEAPVEIFRTIMREHGVDITADEKRFLTSGATINLPADVFGKCVRISRALKSRAPESAGDDRSGAQRLDLIDNAPSCNALIGGLSEESIR